MANTYRTRDCGCEAEMYPGQKRPDRCEDHGNRFYTEAQLNPPERAAIARVSKKRQAEEDAGTRPRRRGSTLKQTNGFQASPAQRAKVKGMPCVGCGRDVAVDPAHLWPQSKGGCEHADCVIPLCRSCHRAFDQGELDLLVRMAGSEAWAVEQAHPILAHGVSLMELVRRLAGNRQELVWMQREAVSAS